MLSRFKNRTDGKGMTTLLSVIGIVLIQIVCLAFTQVANANSVLTLQCGFGADQTYTVSIPDGVAKSGSRCEGELVLDSRVKIVGESAFANSKVTSVVIPNSVVGISAFAFKDSLLRSVTFGNSVYFIGQQSFENTKITSVILPDSAEDFGDWIFRGAPVTAVEYCRFYVIGYGPDTHERYTRYFSLLPSCSSERLKIAKDNYKAAADKAAADKAAADKAAADKAAAEKACNQTSNRSTIFCSGWVTTKIESISITPSQIAVGSGNIGGSKTDLPPYQDLKVKIVITQTNPQPQIATSAELAFSPLGLWSKSSPSL